MSDVLIIGTGPAGCIAALILARGGCDVTLVEQHRFPRDKVCGECLSALGHDVLERLHLSGSFHQQSPVRLERSLIHSPDGRTLAVTLPQPMWGLSRLKLDQWLLDQARDAGASVRQPARCEAIQHGPEAGVTVKIRDLSTNDLCDLYPRWVLLADGKAALLPNRPAPTDDLGLKAHFEHVDGLSNAIELFGVRGHYGGIAPIEDGRWNVAFSVPRQRMQRSNGDLDSMFAQIVLENVTLQQRFTNARRVGQWLASPLPRFAPSRKPWPAGVIPLGNAAASIEPVGGEGMGLAMRSAELASEMLLSSEVNLPRLRRAFANLWRMRSIGCRATALAVSQPELARHIARMKSLSKLMLRSIGKAHAS